MANDSKLLHRAIAKLDGMIHGKIDNRPKNVEKLKNVLSKETKVIYVNQMMNNLLTLDNEIPLKSNESIFMTDTELEAEIIERTFENAKQSGRQVFLIPCDSDMHRDIKTKLKVNANFMYSVRTCACVCVLLFFSILLSPLHSTARTSYIYFYLLLSDNHSLIIIVKRV